MKSWIARGACYLSQQSGGEDDPILACVGCKGVLVARRPLRVIIKNITQAERREGVDAADTNSVAVAGGSAKAGAGYELSAQSTALFQRLGWGIAIH